MAKRQTVEQSFTSMAANMAVSPETAEPPDKPIILLKRIGRTTYQVAVHFSATRKETMRQNIPSDSE